MKKKNLAMSKKPWINHKSLAWSLIVSLLLTINLSGDIYYNGTDKIFHKKHMQNQVQQCDTIRCYVIEGAGYFLKAHAGFLDFMQEFELAGLQGLDFPVLQAKLDMAIDNLLAARDTYTRLNDITEVMPYDPVTRKRLMNFDYNKFVEENKLNKEIFNELKPLLKSGRVRVMYEKILAQIDEISAVAGLIREEVEAGVSPQLTHLYHLNELFSISLIQGQYAARVFQEIK